MQLISRYIEKFNITFFRQHVDNMPQTWLNKINHLNSPSHNNIQVCHLHFTEDCYQRELKATFFDSQRILIRVLVILIKLPLQFPLADLITSDSSNFTWSILEYFDPYKNMGKSLILLI